MNSQEIIASVRKNTHKINNAFKSFYKRKRLADNELNYFKAEFTYVNEHLK
ncbi:hypothetical protein SACIG2018_2619 [Staphylococcus aureus subsp. aureus CIG2018]|nr:hypothetical protein SACIG2018_2619 [Staphylococcus aureus subsp. aureus CIG2018]